LIETAPLYSGAGSEYEVSTILRIQGSGGNFVHYVRSQTTSLQTSISSGPFFTVELSNPQFTAAGVHGDFKLLAERRHERDVERSKPGSLP
jgi:hypothetical protein